MEVGKQEIQSFVEYYKQAARGGDRARFEAWLTDYALHRCQVNRVGVIWDNRTKFPMIQSELSEADFTAYAVSELSVDYSARQNLFRKVDEETLYQLVVLALDSLNAQFCILYVWVEGQSEWKVQAVFSTESLAEPCWSLNLTEAENSFKTKGHKAARNDDSDSSDDGYWDRFTQDDEKEEGEGLEQEQSQNGEDDSYYNRYDKVETALVGDDNSSKAATKVEDGSSPVVVQHISESIASLKRLALASGMSRDEFNATVMHNLSV